MWHYSCINKNFDFTGNRLLWIHVAFPISILQPKTNTVPCMDSLASPPQRMTIVTHNGVQLLIRKLNILICNIEWRGFLEKICLKCVSATDDHH